MYTVDLTQTRTLILIFHMTTCALVKTLTLTVCGTRSFCFGDNTNLNLLYWYSKKTPLSIKETIPCRTSFLIFSTWLLIQQLKKSHSGSKVKINCIHNTNNYVFMVFRNTKKCSTILSHSVTYTQDTRIQKVSNKLQTHIKFEIQ